MLRKPPKTGDRPLLALGAAAILLLLPGGCSLPEETAALVNDRPIPTAALDEAYESFLDRFGEILPPEREEAARAKKAILDNLIDRELMLQEVAKRGYRPSAAELKEELEKLRGELGDEEFATVLADAGISQKAWEEKTSRDLAIRSLQEEVVSSRVTVAEGEIDEYYRTHRGDFEVPEQVRASQILVRTREEALQAAKRIKAGEPFEEVAREVSLSPDGEKGGDLGYFARGEMPQEFDAVAFSLDTGKVSSVIETTYGFHLFLVSARREARQRNTEEARRHIRELLTAGKSEAAFKEWIAGLRVGADIRYNEDIVQPGEL